ncbi:uncharacterized protein LOC126354618 [Schistocerca gregaria]|uniref:uncharacterized protein LOC126354618 n=1 Tax=Schistocerca gregaria TaxID=7010 RepID=UPI00211E9AD8|nr:uncharacterized protein LOC126354618 [Schistocerca gregaria]
MGPRRKDSYSEESLQKALQEVKKGFSFNAASRMYGIPRSTLQLRLSNKYTKPSHGPAPILSTEEENTLVWLIFECPRKGFPRRKQDIEASVQEFLHNSKRPDPFKDETPGNKWYSAFLKRHPEVSERTPEGVTASSACVSEQDVRRWFTSTEDLLKEETVFDVLSYPSRIFNDDETNFVLCRKKDIVLALTGCKNVYEVEKGPAKATLTVMCTFSADGKMCPPMIIYPYQIIPTNVISKVPEKCGIGRSDNGRMKSEVFFEFIANVFHPYLQENNILRPVILFVDGHKTHLTYYLSELCKDLKIILTYLYPNSTRILQPADVAAFRPLKSEWKNAAFT